MGQGFSVKGLNCSQDQDGSPLLQSSVSSKGASLCRYLSLDSAHSVISVSVASGC